MKRSTTSGSSPLARAAELGDAALQAVGRAREALERALVATLEEEEGRRSVRHGGRKVKGKGRRGAASDPSPE